jgi:hypothetical protein
LITCFGADGKKNPGSRNNRFTTFGGLLGSNGSFVEGSVVQLAGYDHGIQYIACGLGTLAETAADDFGWNLGDPGSSSGSTVTVLFQGFSSSRKLILTGALGTILRFLSSVLGVYMVQLQAITGKGHREYLDLSAHRRHYGDQGNQGRTIQTVAAIIRRMNPEVPKYPINNRR